MRTSEQQLPSRATAGRRRVLKTAGVITALGIPGVTGTSTAQGAGRGDDQGNGKTELSVVGSFPDFHVTGVAVSGDRRVFVNQPRFPWAVANEGNKPKDADNVDISVAEIRGDHGNALVPYPNEAWNEDGWDQDADEWNEADFPAATHFVNVQSVYIDPDNPDTLWVLDTGNPELSADDAGIIPDGPKLVKIDLATDSVAQTVFYDTTDVDGDLLTPEDGDSPQAGRDAYLNDVRVDADQDWAFMTDSEVGALVVTDLAASDAGTTVARRLFDDPDAFPETHAEPGEAPTVGPHEGQDAALPIPGVHADGIAIPPADDAVHWHSLSGVELYRSPMADLTDFSLDEGDITIEHPATTDPTDGMIADDRGVYHTNLDGDSITRWNFDSGDGTEVIAQNSEWIKWPDSFAFGPDGSLFFTTSKIHLEATGTRRRPFRVLKIKNNDP